MTLLVETPDTRGAEREYILRVMLSDFLGLDWVRKSTHRRVVRITLADDAEKAVTLPDRLLRISSHKWLSAASMPEQPLPLWDTGDLGIDVPLIQPTVPVIYGDAKPATRYNGDELRLPVDIFGSAFFMLTRYEELVKPDRDQHSRFPANASLSYQEGFLERPIINEYLEILWASMKHLWSRLKRKKRQGRTLISHDVDWPFAVVGVPTVKWLKHAAADIIRRQDAQWAYRRLSAKFRSALGDFSRDPYNTFESLMAESEARGLTSTFFFIAGHTHLKYDGVYSLDDPWISELLVRIHQRGHEIGLHPSYCTYRDAVQLGKELTKLRHTAERLAIHEGQWGGRQHFLRWEAPTTWQAYQDVGLHYDATLGYADHAGFRAGICYEYPVFNLHTRQELTLRERPLMVMEGTILDGKYQGLGQAGALDTIRQLQARCRLYHGDFALLWHNHTVTTQPDRELYLAALSIGDEGRREDRQASI